MSTFKWNSVEIPNNESCVFIILFGQKCFIPVLIKKKKHLSFKCRLCIETSRQKNDYTTTVWNSLWKQKKKSNKCNFYLSNPYSNKQ